jgi:PAS domain S-box-containing protein
MNTISIPVVAMASISAYVGLYHLLIYARRSQYRVNLTFAFLCFSIAFYDAFCVGLYNATSVAEGAQWQRAQLISLAFFVPAFLWFGSDYIGRKPGIIVRAFSLYYFLAILVQLLNRSRLTWLVEQPSIKHIALPFGLSVTYYEVTFGPFTMIQSLVGLVASAYLLVEVIRLYRDGNQKQAIPLILALGLMYAAGCNDTMVSNGLYHFIYLMEYAFLGTIMAMAFSLSNTIVEAGISKDALRKSEERFRSLVETASDWVWEVDANGRYTYASPKIRELLGYEPEEVNGQTPFDLMHPDEAKRLESIFQEKVKSKEPLERIENLAYRKDGRLVMLETSGVPFLDDQGRLLGYRGIDRDVTERKQMENALRESRNLLQTVLDTIPVRVFWKDSTLEFLGCNQPFALDAGVRSPEEVIGHNDYQMNWRDQAELYRTDDQQVIQSGQPKLGYEEPQTTPDGRQIWLRTNKVPLRDADGVIRGILGTYEDITEWKRAEQVQLASLQIAEAALTQNLAEFYQSVHAIIGPLIPARNFYITLYEAASDTFTTPFLIDEFDSEWPPYPLGKGLGAYVMRTGQPLLVNPEIFANMERDGLVKIIAHPMVEWLGVPLKTREGTTFGVMATQNYSGPPRLDTSDMELLEFVSVQVAMAIERKQAELALQRSEDLYRRAINAAGAVPYIIRHAQHTLTFAFIGENILQMTGYSASELTVDIFYSLIQEGFPRGKLAHLTFEEADRLTNEEHSLFWECDLRIRTRDGQTRWIADSSVKGFDEKGENLISIGIYQDITERKRAEEQVKQLNLELEQRVRVRTAELEAANKELEAFSYSVSHDLRAPLRAINSFAKMVKNDYSADMDPLGVSFLDKVLASGVNMNQLIDELLEFSRTTRRPLNKQVVDIHAIVQAVIESLSQEASNRQIEWVLADLPFTQADPTLIQQVYANLIGNAIKYTGKREQARIEVGSFTENAETVYFVRDNGAGFDMQYADKLFSVFQRLHSEREFEGNGIGLATAQRIIQRHGGRIWAAAEPDKGATFFFTLE